MEVLSLTIDVESFWVNYCDLKGSMDIPFPLDYITYKCNRCHNQISHLKNGDLFLEEVSAPIPEILTKEKLKLEEIHFCENGQLSLDEEIGLPENILLFLKKNTVEVINSFQIESEEYKPILVVKSDLNNPVLILYQRDGSKNFTYFNLISKNFERILNVYPDKEQNEELEKVHDEESALCMQQDLPRMTGGGRRILQDFKYICQWCSPEALAKKNRGRFREIRNYRDHFRRFHEDTVPFSEFLNKVERNDPTWLCKICRQRISLGNQLRHQVICRAPNYDKKKKEEVASSSDSDSDGPEKPKEVGPTVSTISTAVTSTT